MSSSLLSALLIEAPVNRHFAQLHRDPQALTEAVTLFLETGLRRGNGVVVIATTVLAERFLARLRQSGVDPGAVLSSGPLVLRVAGGGLCLLLRVDQSAWAVFRVAL